MNIPCHIIEDISRHLNAIGAWFKNPKITLVVRNLNEADGDLIMTVDDLDAVISADGDLIITVDDLDAVISAIARLRDRDGPFAGGTP